MAQDLSTKLAAKDIQGRGLSKNDYSDAEKESLAGKISTEDLPDTLLSKIDAANTFIPAQLGKVINAGTAGSFSSRSRYVYNSNAISQYVGVCTKLTIAAAATGTKYFSIGTPSINGFSPRKELGPYTLLVGMNEILLNDDIRVGETISINGGTATIRYNTTGGDISGKWIESDVSSIIGQSSPGSYVCLLIDYKYSLDGGLRQIATDSNLPDKLAVIASEGSEKLPITLGSSTVRDAFLSFPQSGYVGNNVPFPSDGRISVFNINIALSGILKLSIGSLDQSNFFLKDFDIEKTIGSTGIISLSLDINVIKGQILLIDKSSTARPSTNLVSGGHYLNVNNYIDPLTAFNSNNISYNFIFTETAPSPFATPQQIVDLQNKIESLELLIDGFRPKQAFDELVILGNSLAEHVIETVTIGWWGVYGMAASERSKDFAHVLQSQMLINSPDIVMRVRRTNDWEGAASNNTAFTYSGLDTALGDSVKSKAVVIRLLDNVKNNLNLLEDKCIELITYIKTYCTHPDTKIIATGSWYANAAKDLAMKNACDSLGVIYIPISQLATTANKSAVGNLVMGDDGLQHAIFNSGVASHPGDGGHLAIATNLYAQLKYKDI